MRRGHPETRGRGGPFQILVKVHESRHVTLLSCDVAGVWAVPGLTCRMARRPRSFGFRHRKGNRHTYQHSPNSGTGIYAHLTASYWPNGLVDTFTGNLTEGVRAPAGPEESSSTILWLAPDKIREAFQSASAVDSTTAIALHRVFGTFFDES